MKKILVIGKNGQLAQALQREEIVSRFDIYVYDRNELDITNPQSISEKLDQVKPDICINTSAQQVVQKCEENPYEAFAVNFIAVKNLARACKERKTIFVTFSSDYVFDGEKGTKYKEEDLPNPLQIYGLSKLAGEYAALGIHPERSYIIRTSALFDGKTGSPEKGNFVLNTIKSAEDKKELGTKLEMSSEQFVSPTYASDLVWAMLKIIDIKASPGIYHLVNEGSCSWYEFAKEIFKLTKFDAPLVPIDWGGLSAKDGIATGKVRRPKFSVLENAKAKKLNIVLPNWQDGLRSYLKFLKLA